MKAILHKMGVSPNQFEKRMEEFSEGQKKKVLLGRSLCERAHLYVWDEPLNHIDLFARMQIEKVILDFAPTMIFVEHDLSFREGIATKTMTIEEPCSLDCASSKRGASFSSTISQNLDKVLTIP